METFSLPNMVKLLLTSLIVAFFMTLGYGQNGQIEITQLVIPDSASINSTIPVSGYFKNIGSTVFTGELGLHVQVQDDPSSGIGLYYSSDVYQIDTYSLQPGEQVYFTTEINMVSSIFNQDSKDVIIIFPRSGNDVDLQNGFAKEVQVTPPPNTVGGN